MQEMLPLRCAQGFGSRAQHDSAVPVTGVNFLPQVYLPARPGTSVEELILTTYL